MTSEGLHDRPGEGAREAALASWYVPGRRDGFGDRLLMFDNAGTPALELLRFRPDLSANAAFEHHLGARVQQLLQFRHPAFAAAHRVQRLGDAEGLALVSTHVEGQPLAGVIARLNGQPAAPETVTSLVGDLLQALHALHAEGAVHGAITPDRLVVSPEGRLRVTEHVLGAALQQLPRLPAELWREFGLVSTPGGDGFADVSAQSDLVQAAAVALSMLLARPVTQIEVDSRLPELVEEVSRPSLRGSHAPSRLIRWLENAFRMNGSGGYSSASEAGRELREAERGRMQIGVEPPPDTAAPPASARERQHRRYPSVSELLSLTDYPSEAPAPAALQAAPQPATPPPASSAFTFEFVAAEPIARPAVSPASRPADRVVSLRLCVALAALVVIEAVVIVLLAVQLLMR